MLCANAPRPSPIPDGVFLMGRMHLQRRLKSVNLGALDLRIFAEAMALNADET
jgi:hypothetical protein